MQGAYGSQRDIHVPGLSETVNIRCILGAGYNAGTGILP